LCFIILSLLVVKPNSTREVRARVCGGRQYHGCGQR
jgi:hypothetical protein